MSLYFQHFLLTRFNIRTGVPVFRGLDAEWLAHRFELFEQFCLPSVRGQRNQAFEWLVFLDPETPQLYREKILAYSSWRNFVPVYLLSPDRSSVIEAVRSRLEPESTHLITSRLDNDDAICADFVRLIQERFRGQDREFLNFRSGCVWSEGRVYSREDRSNPFISFVEKTQHGVKTVWQGEHDSLAKFGPVVQVETPTPAWMQVVHERNLANVVLGTRYPLKDFLLSGSFRLGLKSPPPRESPIDVWRDRLSQWAKRGLNAVNRLSGR